MEYRDRNGKTWAERLRDISSGEDSDEGDSLNAAAVVKNAHKVATLAQQFLFGGGDTSAMSERRLKAMREGMEASTLRIQKLDELRTLRSGFNAFRANLREGVPSQSPQ